MLISVIIPVFNAEKWLERCVKSVLEQTHRDLEIILVDDGSSDGSGAICDRFSASDARVRAIHTRNQGVSAARNTGLDVATGEFIAFCDNDDHMAPGMLARLLEICTETGAEIAHCRRERSSAEHIQTPPKQPVKVLTSIELLERFYSDATIYIWDKIYRRELFKGVRFPVGSYSAEDAAVVHHLIGAATKIALTPERLYCHFENHNSVMLSGFDTRWAAGALGALDDRLEFARRENLPRLAAETLARRVYETEYQLVMNRRYNRDKNSRAKFAREMAAKKHLYYIECCRAGEKSREKSPAKAATGTHNEKSTQKSTKLPIKSRIFVVLCRFWPLAYHLYNHLKWPEIAFGEAK